MKYIYTLAVFIITLPTNVMAGTLKYEDNLVTLPGYDAATGLQGFVNLIYGLSISIAALLAVVKIVIAGVKWMLSDIVTDKMEAKKDIQGALLGLILIISAVLFITIINPEIIS